MSRSLPRCGATALALLLGLCGCPALDGDPNSIFDPNDFWNWPFGNDNTNDNSAGDDDGAVALFDEVWQTFDVTYSHFELKGIDWDALGAQYRPEFMTDLDADAFAEKLAGMLRELDDLHVSVQKPDGTYLEVATRAAAQNYTSTPRNRYAAEAYATLGDNVVWHTWYTDNIAYIRVDTLATDAFAGISEAAIEALFAEYASADGFIIDIRANNGGNENIAALFASHFTDTPVTYGYTQTRNGSDHGDFGAFEAKVLQPAGGNLFLKPAVCLIGARNMSSAEWFTLMMDACPNVTLVGDRTRGSSGNPQTFTLSNGVKYGVPTWIAYTADLQHIEDQGITPDIEIPADESFDSEHDYVIERALTELE